MLATLKEVLAYAEINDCAVGAFNTPNLENMIAVIKTAEKLGTPVIISHAQLHESVAPLKVIGPVMLLMARNANIPVCVHLDHGETVEYVKMAIDLGFTSVMYDGSLLDYKENTLNTKEVVKYAHEHGVDVEAEIGALAQREGGIGEGKAVYTDPELAKRFVDDTGIDALAASFGTAHGIYKVKPCLDFERIRKIKQLVNIPLVMHGGSGVSPEDYKTAISCGIRKINYYSYMARAGVVSVRQLLDREDVTFYHDLAVEASRAMEKDAEKAMRVFTNRGKYEHQG